MLAKETFGCAVLWMHSLAACGLSLVPRAHPAFLHFSVLQAMESWAGPGNEANVDQHHKQNCRLKLSCRVKVLSSRGEPRFIV